MIIPFIRFDKQELGESTDGKKLTMLGQIIEYEHYNPIGVLAVEKDGNVELSFQELNVMETDFEEIDDEEVVAALTKLWTEADRIRNSYPVN